MDNPFPRTAGLTRLFDEANDRAAQMLRGLGVTMNAATEILSEAIAQFADQFDSDDPLWEVSAMHEPSSPEFDDLLDRVSTALAERSASSTPPGN